MYPLRVPSIFQFFFFILIWKNEILRDTRIPHVFWVSPFWCSILHRYGTSGPYPCNVGHGCVSPSISVVASPGHLCAPLHATSQWGRQLNTSCTLQVGGGGQRSSSRCQSRWRRAAREVDVGHARPEQKMPSKNGRRRRCRARTAGGEGARPSRSAAEHGFGMRAATPKIGQAGVPPVPTAEWSPPLAIKSAAMPYAVKKRAVPNLIRYGQGGVDLRPLGPRICGPHRDLVIHLRVLSSLRNNRVNLIYGWSAMAVVCSPCWSFLELVRRGHQFLLHRQLASWWCARRTFAQHAPATEDSLPAATRLTDLIRAISDGCVLGLVLKASSNFSPVLRAWMSCSKYVRLVQRIR
jgi:hypothetical protein